MKVIFIVANMVGGGSERVIANLANKFIDRNIETTILMTAGDEVAYDLNEKIELLCIGAKTAGSWLKRIKRIIKIHSYIKQNKTACIISFGTETNLFAVIATRFLPNKLVISERNDPNQCNYKVLRNFVYRMADKIVFQTEDAKGCFCNKISTKGVVIPNPIAEGIPLPFDGKRNKKIVSVGRLTQQKNHCFLIDSFSEFHRRNSEYELVIYGKGELEFLLKERVKELELEGCVTFAGFKETVLDDIKDASMYILSSDYEGISNSLVEAMAVGLPVISTDCPIGGSRMCIKNGENGILVPVRNIEKLVEAMERIANDSEFSYKISINASNIRENYSLDSISSMWIKLLN